MAPPTMGPVLHQSLIKKTPYSQINVSTEAPPSDNSVSGWQRSQHGCLGCRVSLPCTFVVTVFSCSVHQVTIQLINFFFPKGGEAKSHKSKGSGNWMAGLDEGSLKRKRYGKFNNTKANSSKAGTRLSRATIRCHPSPGTELSLEHTILLVL